MATWEAFWELELPATTSEELLRALVMRDLLHGSSYDVEIDEDGTELAVDFEAGDELGESVYRLLISATANGQEDHDVLREVTEQILADLADEATTLTGQRKELGSLPADQLVFRKVEEDQERWDLVCPDWLAPEGVEVPFGFRAYMVEDEAAWPDDALLDSHGRVVVVPDGDSYHLFGIPAPAQEPEVN